MSSSNRYMRVAYHIPPSLALGSIRSASLPLHTYLDCWIRNVTSLYSVPCFTALPLFRSTLAHSALFSRFFPLAPVSSAFCLHSLPPLPSLYYSLFFLSPSPFFFFIFYHTTSLLHLYPTNINIHILILSLEYFFRTNRFQGDKPLSGPAAGQGTSTMYMIL